MSLRRGGRKKKLTPNGVAWQWLAQLKRPGVRLMDHTAAIYLYCPSNKTTRVDAKKIIIIMEKTL
jgi:hypothetical protein